MQRGRQHTTTHTKTQTNQSTCRLPTHVPNAECRRTWQPSCRCRPSCWRLHSPPMHCYKYKQVPGHLPQSASLTCTPSTTLSATHATMVVRRQHMHVAHAVTPNPFRPTCCPSDTASNTANTLCQELQLLNSSHTFSTATQAQHINDATAADSPCLLL